MRFQIVFLLACVLRFASVSPAAESAPLLATQPTIGATEIVFVYGGYLWSVPRGGGEARQLTTGGHESGPLFSPDGKWIAFTGSYDGNPDVFVMSSQGGEPKRLTWHPGNDNVVGWTPDSKKILFTSGREAYADFERLYTVAVDGGIPTVLADVARRGGVLLSGRRTSCLRSQPEVAGGLEALSGRTDNADVCRGSEEPEAGESAARKFQRRQSRVDRRHHLFSF